MKSLFSKKDSVVVKYDIFISYRREDATGNIAGRDIARGLKHYLESKGYTCFFDYSECTDGEFENTIIPAVRNSNYFLLVMTHGALDRCIEERDWVRREITEAMEANLKIIPVAISDKDHPEISFRGDLPSLPSPLNRIENIQWSEVSMGSLYEVSVDNLIEKRLNNDTESEDTNIIPHQEKHLCGIKKIDKIDKNKRQGNKDVIASIPESDLRKIQFRKKIRQWTFGCMSVALIAVLVIVVVKHYSKNIRTPIGLAGEYIVNGVPFTMVKVEGGTFQMGNINGDENETPVHNVTLSDFYIGETEVTQALWKAVMGNNPSYFIGDSLPVENVNWDDCQEFIGKLNVLTGKTFRLPTEAEWEYAARAGSKSRGYKYSGSDILQNVAWYSDNSDSATHFVRMKSPNELGLYDMSGNVWEWCADWYGSYSSAPQINPSGPSSGDFRVLRGGSWTVFAKNCQLSHRYCSSSYSRHFNYGFRLALAQE